MNRLTEMKLSKLQLKKKRKLLVALSAMIAILVAVIVFNNFQEKKILSDIDRYTENGVLIYAADDSAPPLRFVDEDGVYKGVVVDYVNQIALELGIEIQCEPYRWEDALSALADGETDLCDMFINEERSKKYLFTDSIYTLRTVLAISSDKEYDLGDINNMKVATQKSDYANSYMKEHYPEAELVYVHDVGEALTLLVKGEVDAAIGDEPVLSYYKTQYGYDDLVKNINTALYEEEVYLAVNRDKPGLVDAINIAIKNLKTKGQLEKIQQKWFGLSKPLIETSTAQQYLTYFLICLIIIAAFLAFKQYETVSLKRQVLNRTKELETSRNELRLIFNEMPEGVIMVDKSRKIVNCNEAAIKLAGRGKSEIINKYCGYSFRQICGNCEDCIIESCYKEKKDIVKKTVMNRRQFELRGFYIENESVQNEALMVTINDITASEIQNKQLLQTSKMIAIGQLAAGMAHQIRNPLGLIRTHSFIIRQKSEDPAVIKSLQYIDDGVKRASGIIDNVMNFWRISDVEFSKVNIKQCLHSITDLEKNNAHAKKINLKIECDEDLCFHTSEEALKHILLNLFQNAVEAIPESNLKGFIELTAATADGGGLVIRCSDNGSGIKEEDMDNLFNPFFTTKAPGKGTGLGLYIVYSEVENLGGTINVESHLGKGTIFTITLPEITDQGGMDEKHL